VPANSLPYADDSQPEAWKIGQVRRYLLALALRMNGSWLPQVSKNEPIPIAKANGYPPEFTKRDIRDFERQLQTGIRNLVVLVDYANGYTAKQIATFPGRPRSDKTIRGIIGREEQRVLQQAQQDRIETKLDTLLARQAEAMADVRDTAERLRDQFPRNEEISQAVDTFLENSGLQS
jgi:hypothetical protein